MSQYLVTVTAPGGQIGMFSVRDGVVASTLPPWLSGIPDIARAEDARAVVTAIKARRWKVDIKPINDANPWVDAPPPWCQSTRDASIVHITPPGRYMTVAEARERGLLGAEPWPLAGGAS